MKKKVSLTLYSLVISLFTLLAFHIPFFRHAISCMEGGFNSWMIGGMLAVVMLALNFLVTYLLVFLLRGVGRFLVAFGLCGNAITLYFINNYQVLVTDEMMGNVFRTQWSEASGFFSFAFILYVLLLGVLPSVYVMGRKLDYGSWKGLLSRIGIALAAILVAIFGNMKNWPWVDRNSTELGSLIMPWSYIVNTFRFWDAEKQKRVKEIPLPDPTSVSDTRDVVVLMIGESARRDRFSLYGYPRETNPYTSRDSVRAYVADASATYTAAGVRAILEPKETRELWEILPNYLERCGADVYWRTDNWGEPPVHTSKYWHKADIKARFPEEDDRYDGILLAGLKEDILASEADKVFIVIHGYTNHGPSYNTNYPPEFEVFTPVCSTVEMSKTSPEELNNAYDNSLVYTDWLMHSVIETLREIPDRRAMMLFVSDHGESLGENNLYMHGVPYSMAPKEQLEIPFIVWTSARDVRYKELEKVGQHHVFHSVINFFGIEMPDFIEEKCIFAN